MLNLVTGRFSSDGTGQICSQERREEKVRQDGDDGGRGGRGRSDERWGGGREKGTEKKRVRKEEERAQTYVIETVEEALSVAEMI